MELFTINRYDETAATHDPLKEDEILGKLLRKAEKRKRKLEKKEKSLSISLEKETADDGEGASEPMIKVRVESGDEAADESEQPGENDTKPLPQTEDVQFQVLGTDVFEKKKEVQMVLPPWLAHPTIISNQISAEAEPDELLENLHYISPQLKQNLKFMKIAKLFPVQKEAIPWILNAHAKPSPFRPRDICVSAPTGSGKTLAFAVPIVQLLSKRVERKIRALIVLPVTELALQVYKVFKQLVQNSSLTVCLFSKAVPFSNEQKLLIDEFKGNYYPKADIVVTTPGRLVEHLHATKGFCLKSLRFLVIDEADRIMEQLHHNWLYHLDAHVKATSDMFMSGRSAPLCLNDLENEALLQPHKMLFSATLSQDPEKLQNLRLFQPKLFTSVVKSSEELRQHLAESLAAKNNEQDVRGEFVGKYTTPSELTERMCLTEMRLKPLTLNALIKENNWKRFLCFTNSTESANRLAFVLQKLVSAGQMLDQYKIADLSSAIKPKMRKSVLAGFASGKFQGLVCSDALSRGIDIENVDVVISYDVPRHIKTYIHRVGRTARAGRQGTAVTILAAHELDNFNKLLSAANKDELPEIKSNADLEESVAKIYAKILNDLQVKVEHDRNIKTIRKKHEKKRSLLTKNQDLGIMDRLQDEISHKMEQKASEVVLEIRKERRLKTVRKEKQKLKKLSAASSVSDTKQKKKLKRLQ